MKKILFITDLHCGAYGGLTHPDFRLPDGLGKEWSMVQSVTWQYYKQWLDLHGPFDSCIIGGDVIDGNQKKQGGVQLISTDITHQQAMAIAALEQIEAGTFAAVYGTPYHVGVDRDDEKAVYDAIDVDVQGDEIWLDLDGLTTQVRHAGISKTSTPTGGDISLRKAALWTRENHLENGYPLPGLLLRGHVHEYRRIENSNWNAISGAAMSTFTRYGSKQCTGVIHFGLQILHIDKGVLWNIQKLQVQLADIRPTKIHRMC